MVEITTGFRVPAQSTMRIQQIALNTRQTLALPDGRINLTQVLENLYPIGIILDVVDTENTPVGQSIEACWVPEQATMYIRDHVYEDACKGGTRATFTIAHEIGHIVLAHKRTTNRDTSKQFPIFENSEWQANTFAAEFSMPITSITKERLDTPQKIANFFGVSLQAAEIRLKKIEQSNYGKR
jgi:hypothetical protein